MVATESGLDGEEGAKCFLSFRGQLTKCGKEHVRKASSLEQIISYDAWEEAIRDVIAAADVDKTIDREVIPLTPAPGAMSDSELEELFEEPAQVGVPAAVPPPQVADAVGDMIPLTPKELVAAISPSEATPLSSRVPLRRQSVDVIPGSRRASAASMPEVVSSSDAAPSNEPSSLLAAIQRARSLERHEESRGEKRPASRELVREEVSDGAPPPGGGINFASWPVRVKRLILYCKFKDRLKQNEECLLIVWRAIMGLGIADGLSYANETRS